MKPVQLWNKNIILFLCLILRNGMKTSVLQANQFLLQPRFILQQTIEKYPFSLNLTDATTRWDGTTFCFQYSLFFFFLLICYVHRNTSSINLEVHFLLLPFTLHSGLPSQPWLCNITDSGINKSWGNGKLRAPLALRLSITLLFVFSVC